MSVIAASAPANAHSRAAVSTPEVVFEAGSAPHQKPLAFKDGQGTTHQTSFPGVLRPSSSSGKREEVRADDFIAAASKFSKSGQLDEVLAGAGGALHFRGTPLRSADDFSRFMHALSEGGQWTPHVDKGLMVLRKPHAKNVATANEGPPDQPIGSHNEYGLSSHHPSYIAFFCLSEPDAGGETPIASSLALHDRLEERKPELIRALEEKGVAFSIHHPRDTIEGNLQGNGLFNANAFGPQSGDVSGLSEEEKRQIVEANVQALADEGKGKGLWKQKGYDAKWLPDGSLLSVQRVPGVRLHPRYGSKTFFNNIHNRLLYSRLHKATEPPHVSQTQTTALGTPFYQKPPQLVDEEEDRLFPRDWIETIEEITAELQVDVKWNKGDVLLLDNLAVQHARRPWKGDRRLLASLWDRTAR